MKFLKRKSMVKRFLIGMCMLVLALLPTAVAQAAQSSSYISDVRIVSESDDVSALVVGGLTPLSPSIGGKNVVYGTTSSAGSAATEIVYDNGSFRCKSGEGDPVVRLYFATDKDVFAIPNNGAVPVKNGEGEPATFSTSDGTAYLMQVKENIWKPYITNLQVVKAGSKSGAIEKLAGLGCEYYVDEDYGDDSPVFIGYSRTNFESEAITDVIGLKSGDGTITGYNKVSDHKVSDLFLYVSNDDAMGNPIVGIDIGFGDEAFTISSKMLTEIAISNGNATMTKQYLTGSPGYDSFVNSDALYLVAPIDTDEKKDAKIALISAEEGLEAKRAAKLENLGNMTDGSEETAEKDNGDAADGDTVDQGEGLSDSDEEQAQDKSEVDELSEAQQDIDGDDTQDSGTDNDAGEEGDGLQGTVLSAFGEVGAGIFFVGMIVIAIIVPIIFILIRRRVAKKLLGILICVMGISSLFLSATTARAQEKSAPDVKDVAMVIDGDKTTYYDDLEKAFAYCAGKDNVTLQLVNDVPVKGAKYIAADMNGVTLDMNGFALIRTNMTSDGKDGEVIWIQSGADFHIINSRPDFEDPFTRINGGGIYGGYSTGGAGGIHISSGGKLTTENVNICKNRSTYNGGGINVKSGGQLFMKGGCFLQNRCLESKSHGAAIYNEGTVDCSGVRFEGNVSDYSGGAIYHAGGRMVLRSCTFTGNRARDDGGAIAINAEDVEIVDCVVEDNHAEDDGGGIWVNDHGCFLAGGRIRRNIADYGGGVYVDSKVDIGIQGRLVIEGNETTSRKPSDLVLQEGLASRAYAYDGGLLPGSRIGLDRTKSLSSKGIKSVVNATDYEIEAGYFFADRGQIKHKDLKEKTEVFMATALDKYGWGIMLLIVLEIIGGVCAIRVVKKKSLIEKKKSAGGDGE